MGITKFPNGISTMGMPLTGGTTGSVFFVDSATGSNGNSGEDKDHAYADLDYAIGKCTASKGDYIYVMPGHTETAATQITCDVAGVSIIGLGRGSNRPVITAHASAADLINVSAANVYIENLKLYYAASQTAFINISGADFCARNVWMYGAATPENFVTAAATCSRFHFDGCRFESETNGPNYGILIEATAINGWIVENCIFNFHTTGLDDAAIASAFKTSGGLFRSNVCIAMDLTMVDFDSSTDDGEGLIADCHVTFDAAIAPADAIDPGGYGINECFATAAPAACGGHIPPTSDS